MRGRTVKEKIKMKDFRLLIWAAAICGAAVFTGCVDTAATPFSPMEQEWERAIRESYPGYRAPKTMAPGVRDNVVYYEPAKPAAVSESAPVAADDPAAAVDKAAEAPVVPVPQEQIEVKEEKKAAPAVEVAPAAPVADKAAPADAKAAVDKAAEAKPAEAKPAEAKPADKAAVKTADKKGKGEAAEAVVKAGDTIGGIAKEFYGNAKYADVILKANPQVKDAKRLKIGTKLIIPAL